MNTFEKDQITEQILYELVQNYRSSGYMFEAAESFISDKLSMNSETAHQYVEACWLPEYDIDSIPGSKVNLSKAFEDWGNNQYNNGIELGAYTIINVCRNCQLTYSDTHEKLLNELCLNDTDAEKYLDKYWNRNEQLHLTYDNKIFLIRCIAWLDWDRDNFVKGVTISIRAVINTCHDLAFSYDETKKTLILYLKLQEHTAADYMKQYWQS